MSLNFLMAAEEQARRRAEKQIMVYKRELSEGGPALVAVYYGPFPHPLCAEAGHEPHCYQVVWEARSETTPYPAMSDRDREFMFNVCEADRSILWVPPTALETQRLLQDLFRLLVKIPEMRN